MIQKAPAMPPIEMLILSIGTGATNPSRLPSEVMMAKPKETAGINRVGTVEIGMPVRTPAEAGAWRSDRQVCRSAR